MVEQAEAANWWVYIAQCGDGSLYCGIARDIERRMRDHGTDKGARYVRTHGGIARVAWRFPAASRSSAQRIEAWVKRQGRDTKLAVISGGQSLPDNVVLARSS